jgi:succinate dehydrogenase/fumarate reductase flavoprotein subunit
VPGLLGSAGFVGQVVQGGTGGIKATNTECATNVPGLYASGDSLDTRATGARYPSFGFGLRTASVTGVRAGISAAQYAAKTKKIDLDHQALERTKATVYAPINRRGGFGPAWVTQQIQNIMTPYYIWSVRRGDRLKAAITMTEFLKNDIAPKLVAADIHELRSAHETKNMILNAEMMLKSALFRTESRGSHYREDYPRRNDPHWLAWVKLKDRQGEMSMKREPIPQKWWPDLSIPYDERYPDRFIGE